MKDETSDLYGKKYVFASTHEGITLAKELGVSFLLRTFLQGGHSVRKAVDVTAL